VGIPKDAGKPMAVHTFHLLAGVRAVAKGILLTLAVEALAAGNDREDNGTITGFEIGNLVADGLDNADGFMAHDVALFHYRIQFADIHVEVRSADGAMGDADDGVFGGRCWWAWERCRPGRL